MLEAYCRNSKRLYVWTWSRRRCSRRRVVLIVMSEIQGCKISHVIDDVTRLLFFCSDKIIKYMRWEYLKLF